MVVQFCHACKDGGDVYQCASCPRSVHGGCTTHTEAELEAMMYVSLSLFFLMSIHSLYRF